MEQILAFISTHAEHINIGISVFMIILIIMTLSSQGVSGGWNYTYLILAILSGFVSIAVSAVKRYPNLVPGQTATQIIL